MFLPLALASAGIICSALGIALVKIFSAQSPEKALRTGTIGAAVIFIVAAYFVITAIGVEGKV
jgi:K(+)-stimulated pyrophosphate-energized sodium pump